MALLVLVALLSLTFLRAPKEKAPVEPEGEETGDLGYQSAEEQV